MQRFLNIAYPLIIVSLIGVLIFIKIPTTKSSKQIKREPGIGIKTLLRLDSFSLSNIETKLTLDGWKFSGQTIDSTTENLAYTCTSFALNPYTVSGIKHAKKYITFYQLYFGFTFSSLSKAVYSFEDTSSYFSSIRYLTNHDKLIDTQQDRDFIVRIYKRKDDLIKVIESNSVTGNSIVKYHIIVFYKYYLLNRVRENSTNK